MFLSFTEQRERFHEQARFVNQTILSNIQIVNTSISSMASLFEASNFVNPDEFSLVAQRALESNPLVDAMIYVPAVYESDRLDVTRYLRTQNGYENFNFREPAQGGTDEPTFPILYANPENLRDTLGGHETSQFPEFSDALKVAMSSQEETYAIGPNQVQALAGHWFFLGVISRRLIPDQESREGRELGVVGLRLNPAHLLSQNTLPPDMAMHVEISNIVGSESGVLYETPELDAIAIENAQEINANATRKTRREFRVVHHIPIGNSNLRLRFSRSFTVSSLLSSLFWVALLVGTTITTLLFHTFALITNRNKIVEKLVKERTQELDEKNQTLNETLGNLQESIANLKKAENERESALEEAQRANQSKSEFLGSMSHELRTPLNAILGFSDILSEQYFGPPGAGKYREYAKDIHQSGEHLLELVNDLLDISTIEAGKKSLNKDTFPIKELIENCTRIVFEKAQTKKLILNTDIADDFSLVYADKRAMKQILLNLLSNATKFTPEGGTITIEARNANRSAIIEVRDNGPGIAPDKLPSITKPFFRGQQDPYLSDMGWGLGLAISQSLIELHGGTMKIESEIGKGTAVVLELPPQAPPLPLPETLSQALPQPPPKASS